MSDEAESAEKPKAKKSKLMIVLVAVNVLTMGGVGAYLFLGQSGAAQAEEPTEEEEPAEGPSGFGPLVEMAPIVANLNDEDAGRYIKVTPFLETRNDDDKVAVEEVLVPVRSRLLLYFTGLRVEQTIGTEHKEQIAEELVTVLNEELGAPRVRRVFFTEFVIQ